jgi:hypothetical protein
MAKPSFSKPNSQLDLEARQAEDYVPPSQVHPGTEEPLSENGYIGTDPIYQNHANDTEAPYPVDEDSAEGKVEVTHLSDDVDYDSTGPEDGFDGGDTSADHRPGDDDEDTDSSQGAGGASATPPTGGNVPPSNQS